MTITETKPEATEAKPKVVFEYKQYIPKGFSGPPTGPVDVLMRAQAVLLDEAKWVKSEWYRNEHPNLDPDDPFCNSWQACAAGVVALVSIGSARRVSEPQLKWFEEDRMSRVVACPVPLKNQKWSLIIEKGFGVYDDPENLDLYNKSVQFLLDGAIQATGRNWSNVPEFNDSYSTSREDVLVSLSYAIAKAAKAEVETQVRERITASLSSIVREAVHA